MVCKKIGEINRFGKEKIYSCLQYLGQSHQLQFNPDFSEKDFCDYCKSPKRIE